MHGGESELLAARAHFPALERCVHLVSHSLGAMPREARHWADRFLDQWEGDSIAAWQEHWLPAVDDLGATIARVIGAARGSVCLHQNVSTVQSLVASCLDFGERRRVVLAEADFPTLHYVWHEQARRGAEIVVIAADEGTRALEERLIDAIDERTAIVPVSHVLFGSSAIMDVARIVRSAHAAGALVLVDCYQSAGVLPVRVAEWGVDFACGGSVKWACGGPGAAWLYVAPRLLTELRPAQTGWFSHERPFSFEPGPIEHANSIWRYTGGTPPVASIYTARAGWELIARLGVERIRAKSLRQTTLLRDWAAAHGFRIATPSTDADRGGTVCFDFPGSESVSRVLLERRYFHDRRPTSGLRVSPHFYTTDAELDRFMREVDWLVPEARGASSGLSGRRPGSAGAPTDAS